MFNALPEFVENEGQFTYVDFDLDDQEISGDPNWIRKIRYRVGAIAIEFNELEAEIDHSILDWMNVRAEDDRLWVFLESMAASKKIHSAGGSGRLNVCVISDCVPLALPVLPFVGSSHDRTGHWTISKC